MVADTEADILERVLEVQRDGPLTAESARYVLTLGFHPDDHRRIQELAEKSNAGDLTVAERAELERYNRVRLLLIRLKSKARQALGTAGAGSGQNQGPET